MSTDLRVELIESLEGFHGLKPVWNQLLAASRSDTIHLTWEWLYSWAEAFMGEGNRLFILLLRRGGDVVGIAPWYIRPSDRLRLRQIEFLGLPEGGSVYLDVFSEPGHERAVAERIVEFLRGEGRGLWDLVVLRDIPSRSLFGAWFLTRVSAGGSYVRPRVGAYCPWVRLPATVDELLADLSAERRHRYRQHKRRLQTRYGARFEWLSAGGAESQSEALEVLLTYYRERWPGGDARFYDFMRQVTGRLIPLDRGQFSLVRAGDEILAVHFITRYRDTQNFYVQGLKPLPSVSLGGTLIGFSLEQAIADGVRYADFLRGMEEYKFVWAREVSASIEITIAQRRLGAVARTLVDQTRELSRVFKR
jgi:CelD/BcsL family acetyltransferase involved in cellulose biosynthesis